MKLISWNVNGLRAVVGKGFAEIFASLDADFFCLQETKMQAGQLDLEFEGYQSYWNFAEKKGYSGTAIYTKHTPLSVAYGIGVDEHDHEGRVITLEMPDFYLVTCYTPNSQDGLRRLDYRMTWEDDFRAYLLALDAKKPVIVCGDLNVAHREIDLKNPKTNRKNAGFTDEEREKMTTLLDAGFTDSFRHFNPGSGKSFIAPNIAVSLAVKGSRVLIVDGDMRHCSTSKTFGMNGPGLSDYLSGRVELDDIIKEVNKYEGLAVIPTGTIPPNPTELLLKKRLAEGIGILRERFDYILIDCLTRRNSPYAAMSSH